MARPLKIRSRRRDALPLRSGRIDLADPELCAMLAAGDVLRWRKRVPRLGPEAVAILFECFLRSRDSDRRIRVLDPCCGNGIVLAVLRSLYPRYLAALHGRDIDSRALEVTEHNLSILSSGEAMNQWIAELLKRRDRTGSARLDGVIERAHLLQARLVEGEPADHAAAVATFIERQNVLAGVESDRSRVGESQERFDLILTDPPYGRRSDWQESKWTGEIGLAVFLRRMVDCITPDGRIAVALDPAVELPQTEGLVIAERIALPHRVGWVMRRSNPDHR